MYIVYVLYSENFDKIYIGYTQNLEQRLISHNELGTKGWTISFRPWKLVHKEEFETKEKAMLREKYLKSGKGREWIHSVLIAELRKGSYPP
jgi:putative endonuclease